MLNLKCGVRSSESVLYDPLCNELRIEHLPFLLQANRHCNTNTGEKLLQAVEDEQTNLYAWLVLPWTDTNPFSINMFVYEEFGPLLMIINPKTCPVQF